MPFGLCFVIIQQYLKDLFMKRYWSLLPAVTILTLWLFICGCVERKLTINTEPHGAMVILNDEEIGLSPVTVAFNWYGDYCVRINKEGYETLNTHRNLKAPWYDACPFDFFANVLSPDRTVDSYEWTFKLTEKKQPGREELIDNAQRLKKSL